VWPLIAAGFLLGHFATFQVEFDNEHHSVDLTDVILLPAIVFGGVGGVVVAALLGTAVRSTYKRRSPLKWAFNVALHGAVVSIALVVYHAVLGGAPVLSGWGWVAAIVTGFVAQALSVLGVRAAISLSIRRIALPDRKQVTMSLGSAAAVDVTLGLAAVFLLWVNISGAALFLAVAGAVALGYSRYGRLWVRYKSVVKMYKFDKTIAGVAETTAVIDAILSGGLSLFNVEFAALVLVDDDRAVCHLLRAGEDRAWRGPVPERLVELVLSSPGAVLAPARSHDPVIREALCSSGYRDALAIRLPADDQTRTGILVLANRLGGSGSTFLDEDVPTAEALAASASMALRGSDLLEQLRREVAVTQYQATHDPLTGLANRELFSTVLGRALESRKENELVGVMLIDIDGFKVLNDTCGHEAGDRFLQAVAGAVSEVIGEHGVVGRLGGDEFVILVPSASDIDELERLAEQVDAAVRRCGDTIETSGRLRASVGVTAAPLWGEDHFMLMRQADRAMYRAKQRGGGVAMHDDADNDEIDDPSLVAWLREAIGTPSLELFYQPKVRFDGGGLAGVEALVRWVHPLQGPIAPDRFIPAAERSGLIRPLTAWVLGEAIRQAAEWRANGHPIDVAVNISPTQMSDPAIVTRVQALLDTYNVPAHALTLEITESISSRGAVVSDPSVLGLLSCLGVRLSIDDFGVGTSSLARVRSLPVSELKIDRTFVAGATTSGDDAAIVASTIELAHQLGLEVVAEGVEDSASYRLLDELGCDVAQGYLIGEPVPVDELVAWLDRPTIAATATPPALRVLHNTPS
jgi:diguanylate cyclase (GGDEF)-like protein